MILLKEADWFRQSVYKLDYVLMEIDFLKSVQKHSVYDQIRINTLLNLLKSPMEYAVQALTHFKGKKRPALSHTNRNIILKININNMSKRNSGGLMNLY